jgi:serine phosphatase RsbU (regulator of sigma subunit)
MFYQASDGLLAQAGGTRGGGFGRRRFVELLARIGGLPADGQRAAVEQALAQYQGDHPQRDDITVIGFRP